MITLHFHLQPQYKYELFHINFTSFHCMGRYELNKLTSLPMCGFLAQLVEHRTGIAEVTGSNPVEALIFFRLLLSNCLNWKIYCDDHTSLTFISVASTSIWIKESVQQILARFSFTICAATCFCVDASNCNKTKKKIKLVRIELWCGACESGNWVLLLHEKFDLPTVSQVVWKIMDLNISS